VKLGERVVTSGMDKIFPRDLPIGTITDIKPGNPFKTIRVRPSANLARLEEVIVLLTLQPLQLKQEPEPAKPPAAAAAKPASLNNPRAAVSSSAETAPVKPQ
jgi:rod shape-determining protein MreC